MNDFIDNISYHQSHQTTHFQGRFPYKFKCIQRKKIHLVNIDHVFITIQSERPDTLYTKR